MKSLIRWAFLAACTTIDASAHQVEHSPLHNTTNGNFTLSAPDCRKFPDFLTSNPLHCGFPWGNRSGLENDAYHHTPDTGITRYYHFTVARAWISPDGYNKSSILVNGEFPGPAIEANWGDWIEVVVHNNISGPAEGTGIHWHGILQKDTPWYDGVPGISQCPIAPGSSFTYRFRADVYGTSWWHSHFSAQYTAGVFGPLIVYGPKHEPYDIDVGPVLLGDYYHREYFDVVKEAATPTEDFNVYVPWSDNNLINGKNNYNCSMKAGNDTAACVSDAALAQFRFTPGKTHRLRLVNIGAAALQHFSIDNHKMKVIAHDFEPVVPYEADFITLGAAQRTDILVTADQDPLETYWIRSTITLNCSVTHNPHAFAVLSYEGNDNIQEPKTNISAVAAAADEKSFLCKNDDLNQTVPYFPQPVTEPDAVATIEVDLLTNATGHHIWIMNNRTQRTNYHQPLLLEAAQGNTSLPEEWNVYDFGSNKTVRIVLNTIYQSAHPMHLHGHGFQVLAEGPGKWDGTTIINPHNPTRRDTHMQRRYGHLVIQFEMNNPGAWSYHCHIAWHASMGLNIAILERGDELLHGYGGGNLGAQIPEAMQKTCVDWDAWTRNNVVEQIDSGI